MKTKSASISRFNYKIYTAAAFLCLTALVHAGTAPAPGQSTWTLPDSSRDKVPPESSYAMQR